MKKHVLIVLLVIAVVLPGYSQKDEKKDEKKGTTEKTETRIYKEIILEDFEKTEYTEKNVTFQVSDNNNRKPNASIREGFPAPTGKSKKYLGIKFFAKAGDYVNIVPPKSLSINLYCRELYIWVYGKNFSGQLSIVIQDVNKKAVRIIIGKLNFLGWRKLKIKLGSSIKQEEDLLNKQRTINILHFQYRAANRTSRPIWHYFYMDDISASVREKYTDQQSDDW